MQAQASARPVVTALLLLWLAGNCLRLTILAVPPVIARIRDDFGLSATEVGVLSSIPPALFAIASLAGSLLVARLGVNRALAGGLLIVAAGSALRGFSNNYLVLCLTTVIMAAGVAVMQPIMPATVRQWVPDRIGLGTAVYTNGLLVGEVLPVMLTLPFVLPLSGGSWQVALVLWSLPVAAIAAALYLRAPKLPPTHPARLVPVHWAPDWRSGLVWRLGLLFCCINAIYFSANAFMPIYLASKSRQDLIGPALTALNFGQLPASLVLLAVAGKLERRAIAYIASGVLSLLSVAGFTLMVGPVSTIVWSALLGCSDAAALILGLTLPPLLCRPEDTARTSAGVFTLSYGGAVLIGIVSGGLWDLTGVPALAFLPLGLCASGLIAATLAMRAKKELR